MDNALAALNLPIAVNAQALKLLSAIAEARTAADCTRAADRAEGFGLGLETLKALNAASIEGLYLAFRLRTPCAEGRGLGWITRLARAFRRRVGVDAPTRRLVHYAEDFTLAPVPHMVGSAQPPPPANH